MILEAGFDVWIDGNRGTLYQRDHINESIDEKEYWDFSFYEMGLYDIPAEIEYITDFTGQESLSYIGKSLSTT